MEEIIKLLETVYSTMDTISVVGIENQDRFVGCAHAVRVCANALQRAMAENTGIADKDGNGDGCSV